MSNRLIDLGQLCWRLGAGNPEEVRKNLEASLVESIARDRMERKPGWTESLALGSVGFVEKIKPLILSRQQTEIVEAGKNFWVLKEQPAIPYSPKTGPKNGAKPVL